MFYWTLAEMFSYSITSVVATVLSPSPSCTYTSLMHMGECGECPTTISVKSSSYFHATFVVPDVTSDPTWPNKSLFLSN